MDREVKVKVDHLTKKFDELLVLDDISFDVMKGEFLCIVGPTGCGKTTFLNSLTGLYTATSGSIRIDGEPVNLKKHHISYIFQEYSTMPWLNVEQNVAYGLKLKRVPKAVRKEKTERMLSLVGLTEYRSYFPAELSASMLQRVVIARAFATEPELLLMDEPLSHLDGKARQSMRVEIKRLINKIKCTTVYVTHDQLEAMSLADKIAIINFGVLQQFGTPAEVYDDPVNEFVASFIGEPPMNILETTIIREEGTFFFTFADSNLKIAVPSRYYSVVSDGFRCKMGVRPMDVLIGGEGSKGTPEEIATFENLGDERRIGIRVGDMLLMLITEDEKRYRSGDIIKLEVREEKTHLFDIETGNRIREQA